VVGIEATGSMGWFLRLMEELAIECRVGHPTAIREAETRRQKHDRRDAAQLLQLLAEERFVDAEVVGYGIVKLTVTVRIASKPIGAYFHCLTASVADRANASFVDRRTVMSPIVPSA
jgi:hypothetical protein